MVNSRSYLISTNGAHGGNEHLMTHTVALPLNGLKCSSFPPFFFCHYTAWWYLYFNRGGPSLVKNCLLGCDFFLTLGSEFRFAFFFIVKTSIPTHSISFLALKDGPFSFSMLCAYQLIQQRFFFFVFFFLPPPLLFCWWLAHCLVIARCGTAEKCQRFWVE